MEAVAKYLVRDFDTKFLRMVQKLRIEEIIMKKAIVAKCNSFCLKNTGLFGSNTIFVYKMYEHTH